LLDKSDWYKRGEWAVIGIVEIKYDAPLYRRFVGTECWKKRSQPLFNVHGLAG